MCGVKNPAGWIWVRADTYIEDERVDPATKHQLLVEMNEHLTENLYISIVFSILRLQCLHLLRRQQQTVGSASKPSSMHGSITEAKC